MESLDEFYVQTQQQQAQVAEIMAQLHVEDHSVLLSADDLYIGKSYSVLAVYIIMASIIMPLWCMRSEVYGNVCVSPLLCLSTVTIKAQERAVVGCFIRF